MSWAWLVWFVAAVLLALVAGQNTDLVVVRFLGWEVRTYQAVVVVGAAAAGVVLTALSALPQRVRAYLRSSDLQSQVRKLGEEKQTLNDRLRKAEEEARTLAERLKQAEERAKQAEDRGNQLAERLRQAEEEVRRVSGQMPPGSTGWHGGAGEGDTVRAGGL
ncbi:MAG: lipopolysaccharide assembly protein LapA domain-containing protein [Bacillota bacterium]